MAKIFEPGIDSKNMCENRRCVKQVNRYADGSMPYVFAFTYNLDGSRIAEMTSRGSDSSWAHWSFDKARFTTSETWGSGDEGSGQLHLSSAIRR